MELFCMERQGGTETRSFLVWRGTEQVATEFLIFFFSVLFCAISVYSVFPPFIILNYKFLIFTPPSLFFGLTKFDLNG
jgi:hypothetical protein